MTQAAFPYIVTEGSITVQIDGRPEIVQYDAADPNTAESQTYLALRDAIITNDWTKVRSLLSVAAAIEDFTDGEVTVDNGQVFYRNHLVHSTVTDKILELMGEGFNVTPLMRFLARVQCNPSIDARQELYDFCEANKFMIDEDGFIIAYKAVRNDYTDKHSGKFDNSIGNTVSMPREEVDADRRRQCSIGLHFGAYGYVSKTFGNRLGQDGGDRGMVLRVDPADVVSVPEDHNFQKGRCWRYTVIDELQEGKELSKRTFRRADFKVQAAPDDGDDPANTRKGILDALHAAQWQVSGPNGAAKALGLAESTLRGRMKRLNIHRPTTS